MSLYEQGMTIVESEGAPASMIAAVLITSALAFILMISSLEKKKFYIVGGVMTVVPALFAWGYLAVSESVAENDSQVWLTQVEETLKDKYEPASLHVDKGEDFDDTVDLLAEVLPCSYDVSCLGATVSVGSSADEFNYLVSFTEDKSDVELVSLNPDAPVLVPVSNPGSNDCHDESAIPSLVSIPTPCL